MCVSIKGQVHQEENSGTRAWWVQTVRYEINYWTLPVCSLTPVVVSVVILLQRRLLGWTLWCHSSVTSLIVALCTNCVHSQRVKVGKPGFIWPCITSAVIDNRLCGFSERWTCLHQCHLLCGTRPIPRFPRRHRLLQRKRSTDLQANFLMEREGHVQWLCLVMVHGSGEVSKSKNGVATVLSVNPYGPSEN